MILRALIVCLTAVACWHFLMPQLPLVHHRVPGQVRANHHRAQKYVLKSPEKTEVIAGSSMSDRLDERLLGTGRAKLTFPGGGPLTALEILDRSDRVPAVLWFETNLIVRDADETLVKDATAAWRVALRERSPAFTEAGRPSAFGVGVLRTAAGRACRMMPALAGAVPRDAGPAALDPAVFEGMMKANRQHLSKKPDSESLERRVQLIGGHVDALERRGCKVVFYEMPADASLKDLAEPAAIRAAMHARFPDGTYRWLDLSRDTPWQTTDGIHLTVAEASEVVRRMEDFAKAL